MRRLPLGVAAALLVILPGCAPRDFLTRKLAFDLVGASRTFQVTQQFWLHLGVLSNKDYTSPEYVVLGRHGWITAAEAPCPRGVAAIPCWNVALTPLGVEALRDVAARTAISQSYFVVPAAKRQLVAITGIAKNGDTADVDFLWRWAPLSEMGAALYDAGVQYTSTVGFRRYDDGWRVVDGSDPVRGQGLDDALKYAEPVH